MAFPKVSWEIWEGSHPPTQVVCGSASRARLEHGVRLEQREERLDVLKKKCADFDIPEDHVWWYLDTRRFGTAPHAGFGMGFERLVMFATGMTNIRDVIPFPRTPQNAEF